MIELMSVGISSNSRNNSAWSERQLSVLKKKGGKIPVSRLEEMTGKSSGSLYRKAKQLGIELNSYKGAQHGGTF